MGVDIKAELSKLTLDKLVDIPQPTGTPPGPPDVTKTKALAVLAKLREVGKNNGYRGIARSEKLPIKWVRELDEIRKEVITEKTIAEAEPEAIE